MREREITEHAVDDANRSITIEAGFEINGDAPHEYTLRVAGMADPVVLEFRRGMQDGLTMEALLVVMTDRLHRFQSGKMACEENRQALIALETAHMWLRHRARARAARRVEGTHTP